MNKTINTKREGQMTKVMEYDLFAAKKKCRCGQGLVFDGTLMVCVGCYDVFCPSCFNRAVSEGGCFACAVCGWSACI
jgi:hypothetical protein